MADPTVAPTTADPLDRIASVNVELTVKQMLDRRTKIKQLMAELMIEGVHYGKIEGIDKPSLSQAGAEMLASVFMLDPQPELLHEQLDPDGHYSVTVRTTLYDITTGRRLGAGVGSCSTREKKYAYRHARRKCPTCGAEQVNRSKFAPKGDPDGEPGWYCFKAKGGCGAQFTADDPEIITQEAGMIENESLPDSYNTVLKIGDKRSFVSIVKRVLAVSDMFTADVEDMDPDDLAGRTGAKKPVAHGTGAPRQGHAATTARPAASATAAATTAPPQTVAEDPFREPAPAASRRPEPSTTNGQAAATADPRAGLARRILSLRAGFKTQPSPQSWTAIVSYFASGAYLTGHEDQHTVAALERAPEDVALATMQVEHLEALASFMKDLSSGEAATVQHLKTVILKPRA